MAMPGRAAALNELRSPRPRVTTLLWPAEDIAGSLITLESARRRIGNHAIAQAIWPASVGALAVVYAATGNGAPARRSAIAWMMASWGARLTVQTVYVPGFQKADFRVQIGPATLALLTLLFSAPALIVSRNPDPSISPLEIAAAIVWTIAFAGETTADRQMLRFMATAEHAGEVCRSGLWRVVPHAHAVFEEAIWIALALFASASPWGWLAAACPVVMLYLLVTRRC